MFFIVIGIRVSILSLFIILATLCSLDNEGAFFIVVNTIWMLYQGLFNIVQVEHIAEGAGSSAQRVSDLGCK